MASPQTVALTKNSTVSIGLLLGVIGAVVVPPGLAYLSMNDAVAEMRTEVRSGFSELTTEVKNLRETQARYSARLQSYEVLAAQVIRLEAIVDSLSEKIDRIEGRK